MINPTTASEKLLFSTVRIESEIGTGIGTGTGFFFDFILPNQQRISTIITNNHVIEGASIGTFWVHQSVMDGQNYIPSGLSEQVQLPLMRSWWLVSHPNPTIDLCAIVVNPLLKNAQQQGIEVYYQPLNEDFILTDTQLEELSAVEDIFMFGYPDGLWDYVNNFPLIRRGITSSHPAVDFCGQSITVIDAACFPGSSGSPVLLIREETYKNKLGIFIRDYPILLGILAKGPFQTVKGKIEVPGLPANNQIVSVSQLMMHLGYIIKAREIKSLGEAVKTRLRKLGYLTNEGLKYL
jgi:hypothetical protein